jgi:two-component system, sporulation sensor kinase E
MKKKMRIAQKLEMIPNKRAFWIIVLMLALVTAFHYFTGSRNWQLHDFFRRLYYFPIIVAAFKFRLKGALVVSVFTVILYAPHLLVYFGELNMELINQFLEAVMFVVVGLITGYLVEEDYRAREGLQDQIIKVSNLEKYTKNLLNSIDSGVVAFEEEGNLQSMNKEAKRIFYSPENVHRFIKQKDIKEELHRTMQRGKNYSRKAVAYQHKSDPQVFLDLTIFPVRDVNEEVEGAVLMVEDVTLFKELEEQVRRGERLAVVGELSSGVAHEIRNPLGIIKTISQSLREENTDPEISESLEIIEQEIDRANKVVMGLLDFAKPGKLKMENISLRRLLKDLELMTRKLAEQKGLRLNLIPADKDYIIEGDPDKLKQGLLNLVLNGIQSMEASEGKAREKESNPGEMRIYLAEPENNRREDEKLVQLIIEDQGGGIETEHINKIYDPFFTTKEQGTGLGLSITHRIIEEHRGRLEIRNKPEKGIRVIVELPYIFQEGETYA